MPKLVKHFGAIKNFKNLRLLEMKDHFPPSSNAFDHKFTNQITTVMNLINARFASSEPFPIMHNYHGNCERILFSDALHRLRRDVTNALNIFASSTSAARRGKVVHFHLLI